MSGELPGCSCIGGKIPIVLCPLWSLCADRPVQKADHLKVVLLCHPLLRDHADNMALLACEILNAALQIGGCRDLRSLYTTMIQFARQDNRASVGCL